MEKGYGVKLTVYFLTIAPVSPIAVFLKDTIFWYVIHSLVECCQTFRRSYCLRLQTELYVLKMEV